jgi:hypothetical protein
MVGNTIRKLCDLSPPAESIAPLIIAKNGITGAIGKGPGAKGDIFLPLIEFGFRGFFVASSSASAPAVSEENSLKMVVIEDPLLLVFFLVVCSLPPFILTDTYVVKVEHGVESEFRNDDDEFEKERQRAE